MGSMIRIGVAARVHDHGGDPARHCGGPDLRRHARAATGGAHRVDAQVQHRDGRRWLSRVRRHDRGRRRQAGDITPDEVRLRVVSREGRGVGRPADQHQGCAALEGVERNHEPRPLPGPGFDRCLRRPSRRRGRDACRQERLVRRDRRADRPKSARKSDRKYRRVPLSRSLAGPETRYRYSEERIYAGNTLLVLGEFKTGLAGGEKPSIRRGSGDPPFILSTSPRDAQINLMAKRGVAAFGIAAVALAIAALIAWARLS